MIEKHFTSLELSKKLKELGVPQKSEFYWLRGADPKEGIWTIVHKQIMEVGGYDERNLPTSAFLSSELGEMLPHEYVTKKQNYGGEFMCGKLSETGGLERDYKHDYTEADARVG